MTAVYIWNMCHDPRTREPVFELFTAIKLSINDMHIFRAIYYAFAE